MQNNPPPPPPTPQKKNGSHLVKEGQFVSSKTVCPTSDWHKSGTASAGAGHIKVHTQLSHHLAQKQTILTKSEAQRLPTTVTVEWAPNTSKFPYKCVWFLSVIEVTKKWCQNLHSTRIKSVYHGKHPGPALQLGRDFQLHRLWQVSWGVNAQRCRVVLNVLNWLVPNELVVLHFTWRWTNMSLKRMKRWEEKRPAAGISSGWVLLSLSTRRLGIRRASWNHQAISYISNLVFYAQSTSMVISKARHILLSHNNC